MPALGVHAGVLGIRYRLVDDVHVAGLAERIEGPLAAHREAGAGVRDAVLGGPLQWIDLAELFARAAVRNEDGHDDVLLRASRPREGVLERGPHEVTVALDEGADVIGLDLEVGARDPIDRTEDDRDVPVRHGVEGETSPEVAGLELRHVLFLRRYEPDQVQGVGALGLLSALARTPSRPRCGPAKNSPSARARRHPGAPCDGSRGRG